MPISIFHPTFLILVTGVSNAFIAGDLFNLFVSFEILLTASYVLLTSGGTRERLRAGAPYIVVSLLSSLIFLSAIAMIYAATGTVNMADLSVKLAALPAGHRRRPAGAAAGGVRGEGRGVPDVGVAARLLSQRAGPGHRGLRRAAHQGRHLRDHPGADAAVPDRVLRHPADDRRAADHAGRHPGRDLGSPGSNGCCRSPWSRTSATCCSASRSARETGLSAAIYYVAHHILVQTALFLAVGLIERVAGTTVLARLGGLAAASPMLAILFFIPAMNLAGVPPFSGFLGKVGLFEAGVEDGRVLALILVAGGALTSLLTLYAIVRVWGRAFWRPVPEVTGLDGDSDALQTESGRSLAVRRRAQRAGAAPGRRRARPQPADRAWSARPPRWSPSVCC